jgi:AsmA protein
MSRRVLLIVALITLALLATAIAPWTLSSGGVVSSVAQQLRKGYGLSLDVRGRSTIAILPIPRVKFEDVTLATSDGAARVEGGRLRGELRLLPLLYGRIELAEVGISDAKIALAPDKVRQFDLGRTLAALERNEAGASRIRRLIITSSSVKWSDGRDASAENVNLVLNWPGAKEQVELVAWGTWRGERVEIARAATTPAILASGRPTPFTIALATGSVKLTATGEAELGTDPRVTGQMVVDAQSVRDFTRWSGVDLPLGSLMQTLSIEGDFLADRRRLSWPSVIVKLGQDKLDGTLALRVDGDRPVVNGTLAADRLDLSDFFAPFAQARTSSGLWSGEDIGLLHTTGGDLDLRLSATDAKIGRFHLTDMAASILVRPGRIEASLGRANLRKGTLKGRLALTAAGGATEVKAQGSFDHLDLAGVLFDLNTPRWITGQAQGQFAIEGTGETVADLVRQSHGRTTLSVRKGDLIGLSLDEAMRRVEKQPLAASLEWKGGRTAFDQATVTLNIVGGVGDITEGILSTPTMRTSIDGRVSLIDRSVTLRANVSPATVGTNVAPLIVFDVHGGWDDVAVIPDVRALIERSGAAKPLFGLERAAPSARGALASP